MRFLVDESTGSAVAEYLRNERHDVLSVSDAMPQAADRDILTRAIQERRVVVTNDKDFGELVFRETRSCPGVILLRLQDESAPNRVRIVRAILDKHAPEVEGNFVVATEKQVRIRIVPRGSGEAPP